jgi:signal peptidase II
LDYLSKELALIYLADGPIRVVSSFLQFKLAFNSGAAFSFASNATIFLSSFAMVVAASIFYYGRKITSKRWAVALGLALGGIFGNLNDRIFRSPGGLQGEVVDWIQLPNWPIFNLADMSVVSSAILITYLSWKNVPAIGNKDSK